MANAEKCPGCHERFEIGDITDMLPPPFRPLAERQRWHLACHQRAYHQELNRDRRTKLDRAADESWKK